MFKAFVSLYGVQWKKHLELICEINYQKQLFLECKNQWDYFYNSLINKKGNSSKIEFILSNNEINFNEFALAIYNILNLKDFKITGLFLTGVPNSGKSLLANLILDVFKCKGTLKNTSITSEFFLSPLLNSSIILYNEPFTEEFLLEDLKSILGGEQIIVNKKYVSPQLTNRIPFIITSNFNSLSHGFASPVSENAINKRLYKFRFSQVLEIEHTICSEDLLYFILKHK